MAEAFGPERLERKTTMISTAKIHHRTGKIHRGWGIHADCNSAATAIRVHPVPAGEIAHAPLGKFCKRCFPGQMTEERRTEIADELRNG